MDQSDASVSKKRSLDMATVTDTLPTNTGLASRLRHKNKKRNKEKSTADVYTAPEPFADGRASAFRIRRDGLDKADGRTRDEPADKKTKLPLRRQSPSLVIESEELSRPINVTQSRVDEEPEQAEKRLERMRGAVRTLLECVGENPDREGLLATPSRFAKALLFLTKGYQMNVEEIVNNALFYEGHNDIVIVKNIEIQSLCEHHLLPFTGKMHIGYIPSNAVIGLSKLPRIVEMFSRRLQIQERLTKEVAQAIIKILNPQGVAVVMESCHLCMVMRGVEKTGATTITSCVLGCFEKNSETRNEFLSLVGVNRP